MFVVPSLARSTSRRKTMAMTSAIKAMTPTMAIKVRLLPDRVTAVTSKGTGSTDM